MKKMYTLFIMLLVLIIVNNFDCLAQKNILFVGRAPNGPSGFISDQDIMDSIISWGFSSTYIDVVTYSNADDTVHDGYDGIFINETVDSKILANFSAARDNYPLPCINLEAWVMHQTRWGWVDDVSSEILQSSTGTEDHQKIIIKDNSHYITEPFKKGEEIIWSTATDADLTGNLPSSFKEVNVDFSDKLATIKAHDAELGFWNMITVEPSDDIPNKLFVWGISCIGVEGSSQAEHYGTQEFFTILKRASEWTYDAMEGGTSSINSTESVINGLSLFPNPSYGKTNIKLYSHKETTAFFSIIDISGKEITRFSKEIVTGNNLVELNTTKLTEGIYFVKVDLVGQSDYLKFINFK